MRALDKSKDLFKTRFSAGYVPKTFLANFNHGVLCIATDTAIAEAIASPASPITLLTLTRENANPGIRASACPKSA